MRATRSMFVSMGVFLLGAGLLLGGGSDPLTSGRLQIQGNRLWIYADTSSNDADQTVNVGESARVRTCYGATGEVCGSVQPGDPRVAGLKVLAELRGPELPQPVPLATVPGGSFIVPGLQQEGEYWLENIRLVQEASGQVVGHAEPPAAVVRVQQIVLTSATVRALSLEELQARGIILSQENFQAFNFAVGFAFGSETVTIEFPVLYTGSGTVDPLDQPDVQLDGLPPEVVRAVQRWQPPNIVPFTLEAPERALLDVLDEEVQVLSFPLFGAIVLPGTVSYLNQFFEARVVVANGAPGTSGAVLDNLTGALRLPGGNVLRIARTEPPVVAGQQIPVVKANGSRYLAPGEQGAAAWTVEGLVAGTHVLRVDIAGELRRPGREAMPVQSRAQAAVEVVDARFNLTFSHPSVVREGSPYSLFVTVTNLSRATQHLVGLRLRAQNIVGAHPANPQDPLYRTIETLLPGQSETVEFPLVADVTGKVVAASFQADAAGGRGAFELRTGVGELGIPLSSATLVLPRFSERLAPPYTPDDQLFRSNVRFLGLAYSLAGAPAGLLPQGVPRVIKRDVERRAVNLAEAGQRTFLGDGLLESLEVLALDQLGNRHPLEELDGLRRQLSEGLATGRALAALVRHEQAERGLDAEALLDHFASTTSYARPYLAAMLLPDGGSATPVLEIRRPVGSDMGYLAYPAGGPETPLRTLPFGEVYAVGRYPGSEGTVPLAVVGHWEAGQVFHVFRHNPGEAPAAGRLLLVFPRPNGGFRRADLGRVEVPPRSVVGVALSQAMGNGDLRLYYPLTGFPVPDASPPVVRPVELPPFRLIGAVQDYGLDRYGSAVSYLFNRPPTKESAEQASRYRIRSTFAGLDVHGEGVTRTTEKEGRAAFLQPSERVVNVRYATPLSPLVAPSPTPLVVHEHLLDTGAILDRFGNPLDSQVPPPLPEVEPQHLGGLVEGRVLRGTGEPVAGAVVQLVRSRFEDDVSGGRLLLDKVGEVTTDESGTFYFDCIEDPHPDSHVRSGFTLRARIPRGLDPVLEPGAVEEVSSTVRLLSRLAYVNIALLGRGTVNGVLRYAGSGEPVADGRVTVASVLFREVATARTATDGSFHVDGVPVGPLTLTGRDGQGGVGYATVALEQPGATVEVVLEIDRARGAGVGIVTGKVLRQGPGGDPAAREPAPGATVAVYASGTLVAQRQTDAYGNFRFEQVPAGQVSVQAADWRISRSAAFTDVLLPADQSVDVTLVLPASTPRTVVGRVLFRDPITGVGIPVQGAVACINGPGVFAYTGVDGSYRLEGVPTQGTSDRPFRVTAIDYQRKLQGEATLPPVLDSSPEVIAAADIVLQEMTGGVDGVVLDPLGRPFGGATVTLFPYGETTSRSDGRFSFDQIPLGQITINGARRLIAHVGDGLQPGRIGYLGEAATEIVYGGHRPFATVQLRGSGVVNLLTRVRSGGGVLSQVYYRPTWYSSASKRVGLKPEYVEASTDPNGRLQLVLPVGPFELVAYNPFHGRKDIHGRIEYPGQVVTLEAVFEQAGTVQGQVVDVDGLTPVPGAEVVLTTGTLAPQKLWSDAQGNFQFELVPPGGVQVSADAVVGTVARVGATSGRVEAGQTLELTVRMKAQGTVEGRVVELQGSEKVPIPFAQYYLLEQSYPHRRLPAGQGWYTADAQGRYHVAHVFAGGVMVVGCDPQQPSRRGSVVGSLTADWQVLTMPDVVLATSVGSVGVLVRDPGTGAPVPDALVELETTPPYRTVADAQGYASFEALALGGYSVYVFHAPTGRSGRRSFTLRSAGEHLELTVYLDQRGEIQGTLYDDQARTLPVPAATVQLSGTTAGGPLKALSTTSSAPESRGRFSFGGIPAGSFQLEAAAPASPRRARGSVSVSSTSPLATVDLVLEAARDVYFRVFENLRGGLQEVDPSRYLLSVRGQQPGYDFTQTQPAAAYPGHAFQLPGVLVERTFKVTVREYGGEQRSYQAEFPNLLGGLPSGSAGTLADPYRLVLRPKGVVRVWVRDAQGNPVAGSQVTLSSSAAGSAPSGTVSGSDGSAVFTAVPAGQVSVYARRPDTTFGGSARGVLVYDDDVVELEVRLAPSVSAQGVVYQPVADDRLVGEDALVPQGGAMVRLTDANGQVHLAVTDADGRYELHGLPVGAFAVEATDESQQALARAQGALIGPDGTTNLLPPLVLDAAPPRLVSLLPPPGQEGVSRTSQVVMVFSEPLLASVLPSGTSASYFAVRAPSGSRAQGSWSSHVDAEGRQVVLFTPSQPYENLAVYMVTIIGGPNGVRDRVGRPLTVAGNVGSNFKTSDTVGPAVIATEPTLARPVDPARPLRFDFNEAVRGSAEALDGDGMEDAAELYWGQGGSDGTVTWRPYPASLALTRSGFSLLVTPVQGLELMGDTLRRRVVVARLEDAAGNAMAPYEREFRIYDGEAPVITAVPYPTGAPDGRLTIGRTYTLTPILAHLNDVTPGNPGGDIDQVEYYAVDPESGGRPVFLATQFPFAYTFVAAYAGDGATPSPLPVWVRAVDTSRNASNTVFVGMEVLPNRPPTMTGVMAEAVAPVPGIVYAGSTVRTLVTGVADEDGAQLSLAVKLWQVGGSEPVAVAPTRLLQRPASGSWPDLPSPTFDLVLPRTIGAGSELYLSATLTDTHGATSTMESEHLTVAADRTAPVVEGLVARLAGGQATSELRIGDEFTVEFRARDGETAISGVSVTFSDVFSSVASPTLVPQTHDLYRSSRVRVPVVEATDVTVTATAQDLGGNTTSATLTLHLAPVPDPTAPTAQWLSPWEGAPWPASYTSVLAPQRGVALLLRARVADTSEEGGEVVPGTLAEVVFRGPVRAPSGELELSSDWTPATLVAGTQGPGYGEFQVVWPVPNDIPPGSSVPFEVRAVDTGGKSVVQTIRLQARPIRRVYEGTLTAVLPDDPMLAPGGVGDGAVFLLDGATVSVYPRPDGAPRSLRGLALYAGGEVGPGGSVTIHPSVLTVPEVTSYASAIPYYPMELAVSELLGVGAGCRVDVSGRGLLGNTSTRSVMLPGEVAAEPLAGGSHGGYGWYGSPSGGWDRDDLAQPGSVFDSVRNPSLPGGGGGGKGNQAGGAGGGVVRVLAGTAHVHLAGDLLANGTSGTGGGGAGGTVLLVAGRLDGDGRVEANGGNGSPSAYTGGGGGGRVAILVREPTGRERAAASAEGGRGFSGGSSATVQAGAGTIYVEAVDATAGDWLGIGELWLRNPAGMPASVTPVPSLGNGEIAAVDPAARTVTLAVARVLGDVVGDRLVLQLGETGEERVFPITSQERLVDPEAPSGARVLLGVQASEAQLEEVRAFLSGSAPVTFHGRHRFAAVRASGAVRLLVDGDLEVGPAEEPEPPRNDRQRLVLEDGARVALRGEFPEVRVAATPPPGSAVRLGSNVALQWSAEDPLGLTRTSQEWSLSQTVTARYPYQPLAVTSGALSLSIPMGTPPGSLRFALTATGVGGRTSVRELFWDLLPNAPPAASLAFAPTAPTTVKAGFATTVVVHAEDAEGLSRIVLQASGPAVQAEQVAAASGQARDATFEVRVRPEADGSEPVRLRATVVDANGASATTEELVVIVTPNERPTGLLALAAGQPAAVKPSQSTQVTVHAEDVDGIAAVELQVVGSVTKPVQTMTVAELRTSIDVTFPITAQSDAGPGPITATAVLRDRGGRSFETPPLTLAILKDELPSGSMSLAPEAGVLPNHLVTVSLALADDVGLARAVVSFAGAFATVREVPLSGTSATPAVSVRVPVAAEAGARVDVSATVTDTFGHTVQLSPASLPVLADTTPPLLGKVAPEDGASVTAGTVVNFRLLLEDTVVVRQAALTVDGNPVALQLNNVVLPGSAWSAEGTAAWTAPEVPTSRVVPFVLTAEDAAGNRAQLEGGVTVHPLVDPNAPKVTILCPRDGDSITAGVPVSVNFVLEAVTTQNPGNVLQLYQVYVNDTVVATQSGVDRQRLEATYTWTPPADAVLGQDYVVRIEARDYAGNVGSGQVTLTVVAGLVLQGSQTLAASYEQPLVLGAGTFTAGPSLSAPSLTLLQGATLVSPTLVPLKIQLAGDVRVSCGASIDVSGRGYGGGVSYPGAVLPGSGSGGSHVGVGGVNSAPAGGTYGSVYRPQENGGGGYSQ